MQAASNPEQLFDGSRRSAIGGFEKKCTRVSNALLKKGEGLIAARRGDVHCMNASFVAAASYAAAATIEPRSRWQLEPLSARSYFRLRACTSPAGIETGIAVICYQAERMSFTGCNTFPRERDI